MLMWGLALNCVLHTRTANKECDSGILEWTRASFFVFWGAFLNMSIAPKEWVLSFEQVACYDNSGHAAIERVATYSYALLFAGVMQSFILIPRDERYRKSRLYVIGLVVVHLCLVTIARSLILA